MNKGLKSGLKLVAFLFVAACALGLATQPLAAQVTIPQGSTIDTAVFSVYITTPTGRQVNLYRITTEWAETVVTYNSFANSFDPAPFVSFIADAVGWKDIDISDMVRAWAVGTFPNFGFVMAEPLAQSSSIGATFRSSNWYETQATTRPKLVITYTPPGGVQASVTIQRPAIDATQVVDTWVNPVGPEMNYGTDRELYVRFYGLNNKYSLVRFIYTVTPPTPPCSGTGTPGYWMNHPEAWPEDYDTILIGGITYTKMQAIELMMMPVANDKTYTMFAALVAARLNVGIGCASVCPDGVNVAATIAAADAWMYTNPAGSGVAAGGKTSPWRVGEPLYFLLDQYNNGLLCVPHRD